MSSIGENKRMAAVLAAIEVFLKEERMAAMVAAIEAFLEEESRTRSRKSYTLSNRWKTYFRRKGTLISYRWGAPWIYRV